MRDPYEVLGISRNAGEEEIKKHISLSAGSITLMLISIIHIRKRRRKDLRKYNRLISRL